MADKNVQVKEFTKELDKILTEFIHSSFEQRQTALQKGAEVFKSAIENATPKDTGDMAKSWQIKTKYKDRRYVGNTKTVNGGGKEGIPLSNVLEYKEGSKHYGFIKQTFDNTKSQIFDTIKKSLSNGGK
ncbi:HK97 gp10 family phage protein [Helicobacter rodentium]|uniref:HK97 gp10 family phage protein n=1 Tax=Helicobacter rodentium TaxID=59617 RepID=UPI002611E816|nr:HK97 gp10 family phage protein [Helicobacter rodentium]